MYNRLKSEIELKEMEMRVFFYDTLNRVPSKRERSRIHNLVSDQVQHVMI